MTKKSTFTLFVLFVCVMSLTVAHAYQISGQAQKEGETDHSGITVTLSDKTQHNGCVITVVANFCPH